MIRKLENPHCLSVEDVERLLETDRKAGLNREEARIRLQRFGKNELDLQKTEPLFRIWLRQFTSPLVWVLIIASFLAFAFQEFLEGTAVFIVILINAVIGFAMEMQANRSMEALRKLAEENAVVIRGQQKEKIKASGLTVGDLVFLEAGDVVPADCRLTEGNNLAVKEAALTGESLPVNKKDTILTPDTPLADRCNLLYKGTIITRGNVRGIVVATGRYTALGNIVTLTDAAQKETTPLEHKLQILGQKLIGITLLLTTVILLSGLLQGRPLFLMVETAIAMAIAAIPEGLPIVATIALARGMLRLSRRNVIVKKLSSVETLGETQVIFTDKTGTLTENKMKADCVVFFDNLFTTEDLGSLKENENELLNYLILTAVLCNNASLEENGKQTGDPVEIALLELAKSLDYDPGNLAQNYLRLKEIPFDSTTKMMGTMHRMPDGKYLVCIKGALEVLLNESDYTCRLNGEKQKGVDPVFWNRETDKLAAKGLRVLAFAYSIAEHPDDDFFHHLNFIGCAGFLDPPRLEIKSAIEECLNAGVKIVMVTGDHPETAKTIAEKINLTGKDVPEVMHSRALINNINDFKAIEKVDIFARVTPEQKLALVNLYQKNGFVAAMTGDGINDAPALKKADIGIAMGIRGTEAAKESADLILEDDSFSSIVMAIRQGRGIFANIRYFVVYLLSCNLSELLVVTLMSVSSLAVPLLPLQILFLNMVTDVFPALALGVNKEGGSVMNQPPKPQEEPILTNKLWWSIVLYAFGILAGVTGVALYSSYHLLLDEALTNNMVFYTLTLAQLWHVFNLPGREVSFFKNVVVNNGYVWLAILCCLILLIVACFVPVFRAVLHLQFIDLHQFAAVLFFSGLPVLLIQFFKRIIKV